MQVGAKKYLRCWGYNSEVDDPSGSSLRPSSELIAEEGGNGESEPVSGCLAEEAAIMTGLVSHVKDS